MLCYMTDDEVVKILDQDMYPKEGQIGRLNAILLKWKREPQTILERASLFQLEQSQNTDALDRLMTKIGTVEMRNKIEEAMRKNPELFIKFDEEDGWNIFPINLIGLMDRKGWRHVLVHQGYIFGSDEEFNNEKSLEENGIWGSETKATYLAPIDSLSTPPNYAFEEQTTQKRKVVLYINADILAQHRSVWIDPEQFFEHQDLENVTSDAFWVSGGIPAEAIIYISETLDQNIL